MSCLYIRGTSMSENTQNAQDTRSEVEKFWDAAAAKFGVTRKYHDLHPMEQMQLIGALNAIFQIMHD